MKKGILLLIAVAMMATMILVGCDNEKVQQDLENIKDTVREAVGA